MFTGKYDHANRDGARAPMPPGCDDVGQRDYELTELMKIVLERNPQKILEIGTYHGGTLYYWLMTGAHVFTLDDRPPLPLWKSWIANRKCAMTNYQGNSHEESSLAWAREYAPYDFLFIDGDHTLEGVTQDFLLYGPLVRRGGVIAFHDILNPAPERNQDHIRVSVLWQRIQRAGYVTRELIAHPDQTWGGIGVVYVD